VQVLQAATDLINYNFSSAARATVSFIIVDYLYKWSVGRIIKANLS